MNNIPFLSYLNPSDLLELLNIVVLLIVLVFWLDLSLVSSHMGVHVGRKLEEIIEHNNKILFLLILNEARFVDG